MLFEEFREYIIEHILDSRPDLKEKATVKTARVIKNNGKELTSLNIMEKDRNISPTIYLEYHYKDYVNGKTAEKCIAEMIEVYEKYKLPFDIHTEFIESFEAAKDRTGVRVINYDMNRAYLEDKPFYRYGDLAVVFHVRYESFKFGKGFTVITNKILKEWGVSANKLLNSALDNLKKDGELQIVNMFVFTDEAGNLHLGKEELPEQIGAGMYVLSTAEGVNGAAGILRTDLLQKFAERAEKDFYIIPSSIHEIILVPDFDRINLSELREMVLSVNTHQVAREEVLSNNIYFFDWKKQELKLAGTNMPMILEMGREEKCS